MPIPKVLVVDDNEEITSLLARYFLEYKNEFTSISTNNPNHVIDILDTQDDVQLVICDFDFEKKKINGLELLIQMKEKFPHIPFVMMTSYGTKELRENVLKHGAIRFLDKPFQIHELIEIILQTIKTATDDFTGVVMEPTLKFVDIIQFLAITGGDAKLAFNSDSEEGIICFREGEIVHAACGDRTGTDAFFELSQWEGGDFVSSNLEDEDVPQTIDQPWQKLLMDVALLLEKREREYDEKKPEEVAEKSKTTRPIEPDDLTQEVNSLSFQKIENALDRCIDFNMQFAPTSPEGSAVNELRLRKLQPFLRRHLIFHFHHVSTSVVNTDNIPFDFNNPEFAKAALKLIEVVLETWMITADDFRQILSEAISFQVARSVAPAITVVD
ncbi:MAG: response regulator, partial [Candidatus Electryoneaceae bacterium]|nr:response regulator [Candidatus Electryoneaceae bacterium]